MGILWVTAVLLSIGATYFSLRPILMPEKMRQSRRRYNQAVFQDRLRELENERDTMGLSSEEFETLKTQLKRALLDDIPDEDGSGNRQQSKTEAANGKSLLMIITLAVLSLSIALYSIYGSATAVKDWQLIMRNPDLSQESLQAVLTNKKSDGKRYSVGDYLLAARTRVHENPKDETAWVTLAETYLRVPMREAAETALKRAQQELPDSGEILLAQAQVMQMLDGNDSRARAKLAAAAALNPNNPNVLFAKAMSSMQNNRYEEAVNDWKAFRGVLKDGDNLVRVAEQGLATAQKKAQEGATQGLTQLASAGASQSGGLEPNTSGRREILIRADLAPRFLGKYRDTDTVFVMAKMIQGAPMPLAVVKTTVGQLSRPIQLDETHAMMPNLTLANQDEVEVIVRISPSGDAIASTGDLEGRIAPVALKDGHSAQVAVVLKDLIGHGDVKPGQYSGGTSETAKPAPVATPQAEKNVAVQVKVSLDAKLRESARPSDRVFVFARAAKGPRMPLAVKTATVKDLPITVTLTDADAMTPAFRLSGAPQVKILARVSRSGNAQAQPGDLEGESAALSPKDHDGLIEIKINKTVSE